MKNIDISYSNNIRMIVLIRSHRIVYIDYNHMYDLSIIIGTAFGSAVSYRM